MTSGRGQSVLGKRYKAGALWDGLRQLSLMLERIRRLPGGGGMSQRHSDGMSNEEHVLGLLRSL